MIINTFKWWSTTIKQPRRYFLTSFFSCTSYAFSLLFFLLLYDSGALHLCESSIAVCACPTHFSSSSFFISSCGVAVATIAQKLLDFLHWTQKEWRRKEKKATATTLINRKRMESYHLILEKINKWMNIRTMTKFIMNLFFSCVPSSSM